MGEDIPVHLTDDEAKLYDRQIRLWGVESQKSLRNAKVLIISMNGLGAEVAKNIILSGVKSVTFMDDTVATESEHFSQFLIPYDETGNNRATASIQRAKELNPLVTINALTNAPSTIDEEDLKLFDVIIAIEQNIDSIIRLDNICRQNKIKFFSADVFGMFGYFFTDLQEHEYVMEIPKTGKSKSGKEHKAKKVTRTEHFPSFEESIQVDFKTEENAPGLKRMEPSYFVLRALLRFKKEKERNPDASDEDFNLLSNFIDEELTGLSYSRTKISDKLLKNCMGCPVSPVCAIVGAMIVQEIIKAITHNDVPNKNMFFFNPLSITGQVQLFSS